MNIKKLIIGLSTSALMLGILVMPALAKVDRVPGPVEYGPWDVSGAWIFDYNYKGGTNLHDMNLVQDENGDLTGTGGAFADIQPYAYPWTVIDGNVTENNFTLTGDYDNLTCTFTLIGTINNNGSMSGNWTDDCFGERSGSWSTTSGNATRDDLTFTGNHGQWVSGSENKQEAAKSIVGMPVQSKK